MTKKNREKAYKNFRNSEKNYLAPEGKDHSCTSTKNVRLRAKVLADRLLIKNPELTKLDKPEEKADGKKK